MGPPVRRPYARDGGEGGAGEGAKGEAMGRGDEKGGGGEGYGTRPTTSLEQ